MLDNRYEKCILNSQMMNREYQMGKYLWLIRSLRGSYSIPNLKNELMGINKYKNKTKKVIPKHSSSFSNNMFPKDIQNIVDSSKSTGLKNET